MNIFHFAAGVAPEVIDLCSPAEKNKYTLLGSLIYIPLVTGMLAVLFASLYHTHNALAIAFICLVWGGVVFTIERSLIASLRPGTFSMAVVFRVILAFAMSMIISELLILFIFNGDIEARIRQRHDSEVLALRAEGDARIAELNQQIALAQERVNQADHDLLLETNGTGGSRHYGKGPAYDVALARRDRLQQELDADRARLQAQIETTQRETEQVVSETRDRQGLGLLDALATLHEMAGERGIIFYIILIAHLFFLMVELMPLVIKLSFKGTQYYDILDAMDRVRTDYELKKHELAIANQMLQLKLQQAADQSILSAEILLETLSKLNHIELEGLQQVGDEHISSYKQQMEDLILSYLSHSRNAIAA